VTGPGCSAEAVTGATTGETTAATAAMTGVTGGTTGVTGGTTGKTVAAAGRGYSGNRDWAIKPSRVPAALGLGAWSSS
jgi:hypothetical protein